MDTIRWSSSAVRLAAVASVANESSPHSSSVPRAWEASTQAAARGDKEHSVRCVTECCPCRMVSLVKLNSPFVQLVADLTMQAAEEGDLPSLRVLYTHLLCRSSPIPSNDGRKEGQHSTIAFRNGHIDTMRSLVSELGANVDEGDESGDTCLRCTAERGHIDTMKTLVGHIDTMKTLVSELGANVEARGSGGFTPFHVSVLFGDVEAICAFFQRSSAQTSMPRII